MIAKAARVLTPFLTALGLLAATTCLEQRSEPAESPTLSSWTSAREAAIATEIAAAPSDAVGGAVCLTDDGAPYEADAC